MRYVYKVSCLFPGCREYGNEGKCFDAELGIFSSYAQLSKKMNQWPKEYSYIVERWPINTDIMTSLLNNEYSSVEHWHFGIDYVMPRTDEDVTDFSLMWLDEVNVKKHRIPRCIDRDLDPIKDKELIDNYKAYMKACGREFQKADFDFI